MGELPAEVLNDVDFDSGAGLQDTPESPDREVPPGFKLATAADNASITALLNETNEAAQPSIPAPGDDNVTLLAGWGTDEARIYQAVVRELNGEDEEALVKARASEDPTRFIDTLLSRGVVSIGPYPASQALLDQLTTGDQDLLLLGIRKATYGPQIEYGTLVCDRCGEKYDLFVDVDEIPLETPEVEWQFTVPLRKGGKAYVRLPVGSDQRKMMSGDNKSNAERNSVLLAQIVEAIEDPKGNRTNTAGFPSVVRALGIADRRKILNEVDKRMPGPRYNRGVEFTHESCGLESLIPVTVMHLFPGL